MNQPKAFVWPSCTWESMLMLLMLSVPVIYAEQCCCVAFMYFGATVNVAWESINFFKPIPRNHFSLLSKWTFLFTLNRSVLKLLMSNEAGHAATSLKREKRIPHLQKISICGIWISPFFCNEEPHNNTLKVVTPQNMYNFHNTFVSHPRQKTTYLL